MRKRKKERQLDRRLFPDALADFQILRSLVRAIRSSPNPPFCSLNKYYLTKQVEMEQLFDELFVLICLIYIYTNVEPCTEGKYSFLRQHFKRTYTLLLRGIVSEK